MMNQVIQSIILRYILGLLLGFFIGGSPTLQAEPHIKRRVKKLSQKLNLSSEQRKQLRAVIKQTPKGELPDMSSLGLNSEQQQKLEKMKQNRQARKAFVKKYGLESVSGFEKGLVQRMIKKLNLTEDQKSKIIAVYQKKPSRKNQRATQQRIRKEMRGLVTQINQMSRDQLLKKHSELVQQQLELKKSRSQDRFKALVEVNEILTPEQRTTFAKMMSRKKQKRQRRR